MIDYPKIRPDLYKRICRNSNNLALLGLITFGAPERFVRSILTHNVFKERWQGADTCFTLSFDCDFPQDVSAIPGILELLNRYTFKASFACVGFWIERYPDIHKQILDGGHEIINHTYSHPDNEIINPGRKFRDCSYAEKKEELERCHEICAKILSYEPKGSRIPHFKYNFGVDIYKISEELGYVFSTSTWVTNTTSYGMPFRAHNGVVEFPLSVCPKHPFSVFDTWHSLNSPRWSHRVVHRGAEDYVNLFYKLLNLGIETNSYLNIYLDPADILKIGNFARLFNRLSQDDISVVTYEEYLTKYQLFESAEGGASVD